MSKKPERNRIYEVEYMVALEIDISDPYLEVERVLAASVEDALGRVKAFVDEQNKAPRGEDNKPIKVRYLYTTQAKCLAEADF